MEGEPSEGVAKSSSGWTFTLDAVDSPLSRAPWDMNSGIVARVRVSFPHLKLETTWEGPDSQAAAGEGHEYETLGHGGEGWVPRVGQSQ